MKVLRKRLILIIGVDVLIWTAAWLLAFLIRFDFDIPALRWSQCKQLLPFMLVIKLLIFYFFDLYRGMWRYTSISDLFNIIKAASFSSLFVVSLVVFWTRFIGYPRSVFIIDWCLTVLLVSGFRLGIRLYFEVVSEQKTWDIVSRTLFGSLRQKHHDRKNLLIIGAGDCGEKIYREIRDNARLRYNVVGFLDDDKAKRGMKIHAIPVVGQIEDIKDITKKLSVDEALIAIPSASSQQMRRIVNLCKDSGIEFQTIPGMGELINGKVSVNAIREVAYRDLLGREAIKLDEARIGAYIKGRSVLVTGAGGSIGSELCRQICRFQPKKIILYERAETPLYELQLELRQNFKDVEIIVQLADVRDRSQLEKAFEVSRPHAVFHAAAYKHVPMLELQPWKAVKNNIQGARNVVDMSNKYKVERFVFVSTDKAVRPVNVMGATKRVTEMLAQGQNDCNVTNTRYMIVRFGNVVGSVGSVVPLFKRQIEKGGPITVTHPEVTRYFMTIPEACQLILQAGSMGEGGEIFLLEMGTPIKIVDMARDLIRLSGFEPDVDINIEYIGLRPGEKLYEELIIEGEGVIPTSHEKIMVLKGKECNLDVLNGKIDDLVYLAREQDAKKIKERLQEIVPEYKPADGAE